MAWHAHFQQKPCICSPADHLRDQPNLRNCHTAPNRFSKWLNKSTIQAEFCDSHLPLHSAVQSDSRANICILDKIESYADSIMTCIGRERGSTRVAKVSGHPKCLTPLRKPDSLLSLCWTSNIHGVKSRPFSRCFDEKKLPTK